MPAAAIRSTTEIRASVDACFGTSIRRNTRHGVLDVAQRNSASTNVHKYFLVE